IRANGLARGGHRSSRARVSSVARLPVRYLRASQKRSRRLTLHPGFRRRGMQARLGAGPRPDALEPGVHILHRRIEWLIDAAAEVERAIQNDVGDGEPIARDVILALEQLVEPL